MSLRHGGGGFDIDLSHGKIGEGVVEALLRGEEKIEVKLELRAREFGSVYVEVSHDPGRRGRFVPSGLHITEAGMWAFVTGLYPRFVHFAETGWLKKQEATCKKVEQTDGEVPTKGFRLPLHRLIELGYE